MKDSKVKKQIVEIYEKWFLLRKWIAIKLFYKPKIISVKKTLRYIHETGCSIARYGDGELELIFSQTGPGFQKYSGALSTRLRDVLTRNNDNLLVCLPGAFSSHKGYKHYAKKYWRGWSVRNDNQKRVVALLREAGRGNYLFGDAQITRMYMHYRSSRYTEKILPLMRRIWEDRNLLIVEGTLTRLGIGNDLFANAKQIRRILAPACDAFDRYDNILSSVLQHYTDELVLLALGPTATVLAADLATHNIQALDVGHVDIEYEWYVRGIQSHAAIPGKAMNEVGSNVDENTPLPQSYLKQIIDRIG